MKSYSFAFSGGELTPEFWGAVQDAKFATGLARCRNFITLPHGPAMNRAGFEFVREVRDSVKPTRLLPFSFAADQTMALEVGEGYIRFHTQGATLLNGPVPPWVSGAITTLAPGDRLTYGGFTWYCVTVPPGGPPYPVPAAPYWWRMRDDAYEVPTSYAANHLRGLRSVQSADVLTLVHTSYAPAELRRYGATRWTWTPIQFTTTVAPPSGLSATATPATVSPGTPKDHVYAFTSVAANNIDESAISASVTCSNNLLDDGAFNSLAWTPAAGALRTNVYKQVNGLWGYIGQAAGGSFTDDNITPDVSKTPPEGGNPFAGAGNYPGAVTYFEQRRAFAGTINEPQSVWLTRSGTESNLTYSIPSRDDDAVRMRLVARDLNTIKHLVPMDNLLALTSSAEWSLRGADTEFITPRVSAKTRSHIGANEAQPALVNNNVIYAAARGGHVREMAYNWQAGGYITGDLSLRAPHLFDRADIVDIAVAKAPYPIVWMVSSTGRLLGLTYVPEQNVGGWHWHDTDGFFESCCVVSEGSEDVLYVIVRRTIGGATKRYVERMRPRAFSGVEDGFAVDTPLADALFVDSGLTYTGAPTNIITGLQHLEGKTVAVLADGAVHRPVVVTGGQVVLDIVASKVQVGLPIVADLQTLPLAVNIAGAGQGVRKNINKVDLSVVASGGISAGPSFDTLTPARLRTTEAYGQAPRLRTGVVEVVTRAAWTDEGQVCIRQTDPLPLTVRSLTVSYVVGG